MTWVRMNNVHRVFKIRTDQLEENPLETKEYRIYEAVGRGDRDTKRSQKTKEIYERNKGKKEQKSKDDTLRARAKPTAAAAATAPTAGRRRA